MRTPLTETLARFRVISDLSNAEAASIDRLYGKKDGFMNLNSPETVGYMQEPRPVAAALWAFLDALPDEVVFATVALMYSGRDGEADPIAYLSKLRANMKTRKEAIGAVCAKWPRMEYIDAAVEGLGAQRVDGIPALVAQMEA